MDAMTQRLWDSEFEKQYPKPQRCYIPYYAISEYIDACDAVYAATYGDDIFCRRSDFAQMYHSIYCSENVDPWHSWRKECLDRFQAIYKAQPIQALESLRSGNLLID